MKSKNASSEAYSTIGNREIIRSHLREWEHFASDPRRRPLASIERAILKYIDWILCIEF